MALRHFSLSLYLSIYVYTVVFCSFAGLSCVHGELLVSPLLRPNDGICDSQLIIIKSRNTQASNGIQNEKKGNNERRQQTTLSQNLYGN